MFELSNILTLNVKPLLSNQSDIIPLPRVYGWGLSERPVMPATCTHAGIQQLND
jgi:hypothetical protein